jgi:L-alanine-DL-glutamate epimerase-like enolase superfamily enzyme
MTCKTSTGTDDWRDKSRLLDGPYIQDGFVPAMNKPGLGVELDSDVVKAPWAPDGTWWG